MTAFLVVAWGNAILLEPLFALPSNAVHLPVFQTGERGAFLQLSLLSCWQRREWSEIQSLSQLPNLLPHAQKSPAFEKSVPKSLSHYFSLSPEGQ